MAVQSEIFSTEYGVRSFISTKHIATKQHIAVWLQRRSDNLWVQLSQSNYELINNSAVLTQAPNATTYSQVEIRVADAPDELGSSQSEIAVLAGISDEIVSLYSIKDEIVSLESIKVKLESLYADKVKLDSIYSDKATLDSIYAYKSTLDSIYADKTKLDSIYADKSKLDSLYADKATLDSLFADKATLDSLFADKATLDSLYADKTKLDALYTDLSGLESIYTNLTTILDAENQANIALTQANRAEDEANRAQEYADSVTIANIETISELSTINTSVYTTAIVKDIDRGGTFIWSSTGTANGGTVFAGVSGYWHRQYSGAIKIDWFGAHKSTDCTNEIRSCLDWVQDTYKTSNVNEIYFMPRVMIEFTHGRTYTVNGDNVLGCKSISTNISYGIEGNGAKINWIVNATTDSLFKNMSKVYKFYLNNIQITLASIVGLPSGIGGNLMTSNSPLTSADGFSYWKHYSISNVSVWGQGANYDNIFLLDGWNWCDETTVTGCNFYNFNTFFHCKCPESVQWTFSGVNALTYVDGFTMFHINTPSGGWTGGLFIVGGGYISTKGGTYIKVSNGTGTGSAGEIYANTRWENHSEGGEVVTFVDAYSGKIKLSNINFTAGNAGTSLSNIAVINRKKASVIVEDCFVKGRIIQPAYTISEWDVIFAGNTFQDSIIFNRCKFATEVAIEYYTYSTWTAETYLSIITSAKLTGTTIVTGSDDSINSKYGIPNKDSSNAINTIRFGNNTTGNGYPYLVSAAEYKLALPEYSIIKSAKLNIGVLPANYTKIGIFFNSSYTTAVVEYALALASVWNAEMIPANKRGICIPKTRANSKMSVAVYNSTTSLWEYNNSSISGWIDLIYETMTHRYVYPSDEAIKLQ